MQTVCAANCSISMDKIISFISDDDDEYGLKRLDLSGSVTKPKIIEHLVKCKAFKNLEYLNLSRCTIDDKSL